MKGEGLSKEQFSKYTVEQLFEIVRVANRVNVRYKHGAIVKTDYAADALVRSLHDLDTVFKGEKLERGK